MALCQHEVITVSSDRPGHMACGQCDALLRVVEVQPERDCPEPECMLATHPGRMHVRLDPDGSMSQWYTDAERTAIAEERCRRPL